MTIKGITIRKALLKDLDQLITLCDDHAAHEDAPYSKIGKKERLALHLFSEKPPITCLVVVQDGTLKGYATYCKVFSTWDAAYYMHLDCLFIKEEIRDKGIGKELMRMISTEAEEADCVNIQGETSGANSKALSFFQKQGAKSKNKLRFYLQ